MQNRNAKLTWLLVTTILSLGYCLPEIANAQAAAAPGKSNATGGASEVGEVLITARKQSEVLSKVGISVTAATGVQLARRGITTVDGLVKLEPSLQFSKSSDGTPIMTIRGVGYNEASIEAPPTISVYQDEIPYTYPVMTKGAMLDVEHVEILKGPQGTLYGQNATGGAINFIANKPTNYFTAGATATYGNYNAAHFDFYVSGPIAETLTGRLAMATDQGGAWQHSYTRDDTLGNKNDIQGRLLLDWKPTDTFNAVLNVNAWQDLSDSQAPQLSGYFVKDPQYVGLGGGNRSPTPAQIAAMPAYAAGFRAVLSEPIAPQNDEAADWVAGTHPHADEHFYQANLRMDWTVNSAFSITSLTSFEGYDQRDYLDLAGIAVPATSRRDDGNVDSFFQELRAHGTFADGKGNWQVGANFIRDASHEYVDQNGLYSASFLGGWPPSVGGNPSWDNVSDYGNNTTETKSIFADVSVPLLPTLKHNAGIRYTAADAQLGGCTGSTDWQLESLVSHAFGNGTAVNVQCDTVLYPGGPSGYVTNKLDQTNMPWRVGLEWQVTDETLIYGLVSKGYKAGAAPVLGSTVAAQFKPVTQESLQAYEAGIKSRLFENKLRVNADVFYYDYVDKQLEGTEVDPVWGPLLQLVNIPKSHEFGAEANIVWLPVTGLTLDVAVTYLNSRVDSNFPNTDAYGDAVNFQGEAFPFAPKWSTSAGARYDWAVNDQLRAFVAARGSYQTATVAAFGESAVDANGYPSLGIKAYGLIDLSAGLEPAGGHWRVEVWGRNVTNTYYWTAVNYIVDSTARLTGMPATYGVTVGYKY